MAWRGQGPERRQVGKSGTAKRPELEACSWIPESGKGVKIFALYFIPARETTMYEYEALNKESEQIKTSRQCDGAN